MLMINEQKFTYLYLISKLLYILSTEINIKDKKGVSHYDTKF